MRHVPDVPEIINQQRSNYIEAIANDGFLGFAGGCALTGQKEIIGQEGIQIAELQDMDLHLATGQRLNPRKPRSKRPDNQPQPWKGLETTEPKLAEEIVESQALQHGSVVLEVMLPEHTKWIDRASMVWTGSRNEDEDLIWSLAMHDIRVVFGLKNAMDGTYKVATERQKRINEAREKVGRELDVVPAPVLVIYRGGEIADSPEAWEDQRQGALTASEGLMIDDTAHGSSMAHDNGRKSDVGQARAAQHIKRLTQAGYASLGLITEASATDSLVDKNRHLEEGLRDINEIYRSKLESQVALAA